VEDLAKCRAAIDRFTAIRMSVGLRLRTAENRNFMDNYYLASRLRSAGFDNLLPVPYELYRVNAALEYLLSLNPFFPQKTIFAYSANDPPLGLVYAHGFAKAPFQVINETSPPIHEPTIFVTTSHTKARSDGVMVINEADLLDLFP
jgi:hypothetical protein